MRGLIPVHRFNEFRKQEKEGPLNLHAMHKTSLMEMIGSFMRNRQLILQMTKREVVGRYRGSVMGIAWSFFNPLIMLAVYTFVFSVVFKSRWGTGTDAGKGGFAILLFAGMIVHGTFSECINRAPSLVVSNVNYVKKVLFPLEALPWISLGAALFHSAISLIVLLAVQYAFSGLLPWTTIFMPIVLIPLVLFTMGATWFLASLGVYVRDVAQTVGIITSVLLFLSPVFYPISALPERYRFFMLLNPLTYVIEEARNVLVYEATPDWFKWIAFTAIGLLVAMLGFWWFQKTRKGFADVL